jgi:hypothetical protein
MFVMVDKSIFFRKSHFLWYVLTIYNNAIYKNVRQISKVDISFRVHCLRQIGRLFRLFDIKLVIEIIILLIT